MACGSCRACRGHGRAFEVIRGGCAPTPAWKTLRVSHSRLDAVLRSPVRGPRPQAPTGPLSPGYFLDGSTIAPKVTFLDGLTGPCGGLEGFWCSWGASWATVALVLWARELRFLRRVLREIVPRGRIRQREDLVLIKDYLTSQIPYTSAASTTRDRLSAPAPGAPLSAAMDSAGRMRGSLCGCLAGVACVATASPSLYVLAGLKYGARASARRFLASSAISSPAAAKIK